MRGALRYAEYLIHVGPTLMKRYRLVYSAGGGRLPRSLTTARSIVHADTPGGGCRPPWPNVTLTPRAPHRQALGMVDKASPDGSIIVAGELDVRELVSLGIDWIRLKEASKRIA